MRVKDEKPDAQCGARTLKENTSVPYWRRTEVGCDKTGLIDPGWLDDEEPPLESCVVTPRGTGTTTFVSMP